VLHPPVESATHFGQTNFSKAVSQSNPGGASGAPQSGHWRPHSIGQLQTLCID
jgi:hypothetical protein